MQWRQLLHLHTSFEQVYLVPGSQIRCWTLKGYLLALFSDNSQAGGVCDSLVILGPNKLRALFHLRALKDHRDHTIIINIHINLFGA